MLYWGLDLSRIFLLKSHLDWRPPHETQFYLYPLFSFSFTKSNVFVFLPARQLTFSLFFLMLLAKQGGWSLKQMQKSYSTYLSGSVLHEVHDYDCDIFKVHTCVGTHFGAVIAYHRVGTYFAFWSWIAGAVQGAAAGCRCKVLLSECCVGYGAGLLCSCRGAAAGCRFKVLQSAVCALEAGCWCAAAEGPWWVGMPFSLV